jgi:hypothetical protein
MGGPLFRAFKHKYMKESLLYKKLKIGLENFNRNILFQRIESGATGLGIPDIFYRTLSKDGWIELKELQVTSNSVTIPFRPGQRGWLLNYCKLGGLGFVFGTIGNELYILSGYNIEKKYSINNFHKNSLYLLIWNFSTIFDVMENKYVIGTNKRKMG